MGQGRVVYSGVGWLGQVGSGWHAACQCVYVGGGTEQGGSWKLGAGITLGRGYGRV
jgi:hypothetical protein